MNNNFISFLRLLQLILIGLKAAGYVDFDWVFVFIPAYADGVLYIVEKINNKFTRNKQIITGTYQFENEKE